MFYPTTCVGLRYGLMQHLFSGFSWESDYHRYRLARGLAVLSRFSSQGGFACPAITFTLQRTIPSVRRCVTAPSPRHCYMR